MNMNDLKNIEPMLNDSLKACKGACESLPVSYIARMGCNYPTWYKGIQVVALGLHTSKHEYIGCVLTSIADCMLVAKALKDGNAKKEVVKLTTISCVAYGLGYMIAKNK